MKVKEAVATYHVPKKVYSYQDYFELPDDGNKYEIIEGELIMSPAPFTMHQRIVRKIIFALLKFIEEEQTGELFFAPTDVVLSNSNVIQPDILFILNENLNIITEKNIKGVPDLIIEIISPATGYYDLSGKKDLYEKFGVREYWIIDPMKQRVDIYYHSGKKFELSQRLEKEGQITSHVLKGLQINLKKIFEIE
ncbi:MAG TPA: Uma2 family endonuclease [bacterium]